jgi:NTP pyrophosphatase (non-canonical NTP hydrolase)
MSENPRLMNPWLPMKDPVDLKHLGKLLEELGECTSAVSRCVIQGIDECEPSTGKSNRQWLREEIADVLCGFELCIERFGLDRTAIERRKERKKLEQRAWHPMAGGG